ncbi:hypothetical protein Xcab_03931 [Xenorhabdus cabanillasii JM26]|nr:hypothetical protein Xcab_03931 [Xenorhabdus cabanillasii JM26]
MVVCGEQEKSTLALVCLGTPSETNSGAGFWGAQPENIRQTAYPFIALSYSVLLYG